MENTNKINNEKIEINTRVLIDLIVKLSSINKIISMLLDLMSFNSKEYEENFMLTSDEQGKVVAKFDEIYHILYNAHRRELLKVQNKEKKE